MAEDKRRTGRPKVQDGKRSFFVNVRFSEEEFNLIAALQKQLGISRTELIRTRVLSNARQKVINAKELLEHLDIAGVEMARIGNNINQLARHANILKLKGVTDPAILVEFNLLFAKYLQVKRSLDAALRQIIRAMSN